MSNISPRLLNKEFGFIGRFVGKILDIIGHLDLAKPFLENIIAKKHIKIDLSAWNKLPR